MALSKEQIEAKEKFMRYFWIWERDLLECAKRWPAWREKARELGFRDAKIDAPWIFPDAGRQIKYAEIMGDDSPGRNREVKERGSGSRQPGSRSWIIRLWRGVRCVAARIQGVRCSISTNLQKRS